MIVNEVPVDTKLFCCHCAISITILKECDHLVFNKIRRELERRGAQDNPVDQLSGCAVWKCDCGEAKSKNSNTSYLKYSINNKQLIFSLLG